jgi:hypothetical protein
MLFLVTSSVCETTGYAILTDKLKGTTPTPTGSLKKPSPEGLYEVLCGTILQEVIETIEKDNRALMNLGGFTGQALTYSASYNYCTRNLPLCLFRFRAGQHWCYSDGNTWQWAHASPTCLHDYRH